MTVLGCIADDYTGGTDVAAALRRAGLRTALLFGRPRRGAAAPPADAVVVALKTRTAAPSEAVRESLLAREWLVGAGATRLYYKYCSTFDSTDQGNIGVVADALLDAAGAGLTVVCPAAPEHGRTVYQGHLFVGDRLLSETPMRHHPLTPMTDPDLVRVLRRQTPHPVSRIPLQVVRQGPAAVRAELDALRTRRVRFAVTDATGDDDLAAIAHATEDFAMLTGAAGLARAVGAVARTRGSVAGAPVAVPPGSGVVLAGSCSATTLSQVAQARAVLPAYRLDPAAAGGPDRLREDALRWLRRHADGRPVMVYSSAPPEQRAGRDAAQVLEQTLAALGKAAVDLGYRRLVVAGGETAGAVVNAVGVDAVEVAAEEDRGVPWCVSTGAPRVALLLKSGNFGGPDLLVRAATGAAG